MPANNTSHHHHLMYRQSSHHQQGLAPSSHSSSSLPPPSLSLTNKRKRSEGGGEGNSLGFFDSVASLPNGTRQLKISAFEGELSATFSNPSFVNTPPMSQDLCSAPLGVQIPKNSYKHFENLNGKSVECSFLGNNCNSCLFKGGNHSIKGKQRVFFFRR